MEAIVEDAVTANALLTASVKAPDEALRRKLPEPLIAHELKVATPATAETLTELIVPAVASTINVSCTEPVKPVNTFSPVES